MAEEIIYLGRDNTIDLLLKAENDAGVSVAWPLDGVVGDIGMVATQIDAIFSSTLTISSDDAAAGPITWAQAGYDTGEIRISFDADDEADLAEGQYSVTIVVYDVGNTDGIVWNTIPIRAKEI